MTPEDRALRARLLRGCRPTWTLDDLEYTIRERLPASVECRLTRRRAPDLLPGTVRITVEEPERVPTPGTMAFHLWALRGLLAPLQENAAAFYAGGTVGVALGILAGFLTWGLTP